ncbi:MAG: transcriptional regulator, LuxR family [Myxococcales bacterium]|nr:transcriptional regulator, LuxR family [Myxococcales bacterium]
MGGGVGVRDRRRLAELTRGLAEWDGGSESALTAFLPEFHSLLGMDQSFSYKLEETNKGFSVSYLAGAGFDVPRGTKAFDQFIRNRLTGWAGFNAIAPEPTQRNRVLNWTELCKLQPSASNAGLIEIYRRIGFREDDQIRSVICDGASLLAWVGGFRSERFTERETALFAAMVPALERRLRMERQLANAELCSASLTLILENVAAAAFIVSSQYSIVHTNAAGRLMLASDRAKTFERIDQCIRGGAPIGWTVLAVAPRGVPGHHVIIASDPDRDEALVAIATRRWALTGAQASVLKLLVLGNANKTIAAELKRSLGTIELHVTAILRKANVDSRAALIARYWSLRFS